MIRLGGKSIVGPKNGATSKWLENVSEVESPVGQAGDLQSQKWIRCENNYSPIGDGEK